MRRARVRTADGVRPAVPLGGASGRERGAVLVALALALVGGGALWLAATVPTPPPGVDEDRRRLLAARRALLAHVSAYPESYGPAGAGPGHLPCPDTDTSLDADVRASSGGPSSPFRGDGPDPPCGGDASLAGFAVGRLPRHVSLPSHREAFHHESAQRLVYAVSTRLVNNPLGRVVNPASVDAAGGVIDEDDVIAIIADAGGSPLPSLATATALVRVTTPREVLRLIRTDLGRGAGDRATVTLGHVPLRRGELIAAARRRVGAWFVARLVAAARAQCDSVARRRAAPTAEPDVSDAPCPRWPALDPRCVVVDAERLLAWLGDDRPVPRDCTLDPPPPPSSIENTPRERHWFVRNGWHRFVSLRIDTACLDANIECAPRWSGLRRPGLRRPGSRRPGSGRPGSGRPDEADGTAWRGAREKALVFRLSPVANDARP